MLGSTVNQLHTSWPSLLRTVPWKSFLPSNWVSAYQCASHRFNIAVKYIISGHRPLIHDTKSIMIKPWLPLWEAKIKKLTDPAPVTCNDTGCSPWRLIFSYTLQFENIFSLYIAEIDSLPLLPRQEHDVGLLMNKTKVLDGISAAL